MFFILFSLGFFSEPLFANISDENYMARDTLTLAVERIKERLFLYLSDSSAEEELQGGGTAGSQAGGSGGGLWGGPGVEEEIEAHFQSLFYDKIDLNRASDSDLASLLLLSPFQILALKDYRKRTGNILSFAELEHINGFSASLVEAIRPFCTLGQDRMAIGAGGGRFSNDLFLRGAVKSSGTAFLLKYKASLGKRFSFGLLAENDAGEAYFPSFARAFDFISFNLALKNSGALRSLVAGDFSLRFGQGLILWNSAFFPMQGSTSSFFKYGEPLKPYSSSVEEGFFRGVAATLKFGNYTITPFFSYNRVDANIKGDSYTSLPTGGLHISESELRRRRSMGELAGGLSVGRNCGSFSLALNYVTYKFDKRNGRKPSYYNREQFYDGLWGNLSLSCNAMVGRKLFFGELAFDYAFSLAALAGVTAPIGNSGEGSLLVRYYPSNYIARYAGAYSISSGCYNQLGLALAYFTRVGNSLSMTYGLDLVSYPSPRYNIRERSYTFKGNLKLIYENRVGVSYWLRLSGEYHSATSLSKGVPVTKFSLSSSGLFPLARWLSLRFRGGCALYYCANSPISFSGACGSHLRAEVGRSPLVVKGGITYFNAPLWANRLYTYESELPFTFSGRLLYGEGTSIYLLAECRLFRALSIYARYGITKNLADLKFAARLKL